MKIFKSKKGFAWILAVVVAAIILLIGYGITHQGEVPTEILDLPLANCEANNPSPWSPPLVAYYDSSCSCEDDYTKGACSYTPYEYDDPNNPTTSTGGHDCIECYCKPKTCTEYAYGVDSCIEDEVCAGSWVSPPNGDNRCCSEECVAPCGSGTSLSCYSLDEANEMDEATALAGFTTCADQCPEMQYLVEGPQSESKWCEKCSEPAGALCCIYCPSKTYYCPTAKKCVGALSCNSCETKSGLPFNSNEGDSSTYTDTGYSICKKECNDIDLGDGIIWKAYSIDGVADEWCNISNGGTDFEGYNKCCAYCPPETHHSPATLSCEPDTTVSELTPELQCPYIRLEWGEYENAVSYNILLFYDVDDVVDEDGSCPEDKVNVEESPYYYDLSTSNCLEYYTKNVKLLLTPQYASGDYSIDSDETEWIDVSECNIGSNIGTSITNTENCTNNEDDDVDGLIDCKDITNCQEGTICSADGTKTCQLEICKESGLGLEEEHKDDLTGTKDDYDGDGTINEDDSNKDGDFNKDGDEIPNLDDKEEWTQLGCEADDNGVAINVDGDNFCKGLDCDDNDKNIKVTKDDPACTKEMLCSNKEKDTKTNEIDVDLGGDCRPYIELVQPKYGVSEESPFDLIVSTDHDATCKFREADVKYENMLSFSSSGGKTHTKTDFSLDDENIHKFYVRCDDTYWDPDENVVKFELSIDPSKPVITTAKADDIIEIPLKTLLVVETDDETICKYDSTEQEYASMSKKFPKFDEPDFSEAHTQKITLQDDTSKDYTYYVACENRAGLISEPEDIMFRVDLNKDLIITQITPKYINKSSVSLSITTNKNAECYYNNVSTETEINLPFGASGYEHKKLLPPLSDGHHNYYVKCYRGTTTSIKDIEFNIDTAPVETPIVNDTSNIDDYPEYSYHTNKVRVKWVLDKKPASGIDYYLYMLED